MALEVVEEVAGIAGSLALKAEALFAARGTATIIEPEGRHASVVSSGSRLAPITSPPIAV